MVKNFNLQDDTKLAYEIQTIKAYQQHLFFLSRKMSLFYIYEYKFNVENKNTKKDIQQASKHLRMRGTNLLNLTTSNFN